ncbi:MAG: BON domain-containing protein [Acidobacteriota bacterium]|nr:BON domain-containing protein [Acidobacteriota bacterium]
MKRKIGLALCAGSLLLSSGLVAKEKDKDKDHLDPYVTGPAGEVQILKEVRHQLVLIPFYNVFDDIGFTVNDGTVTLVGQVTEPYIADDAGRAVKRVQGVTNVVNNIEVLPLSPNDDRIRRGVYRAVYGDPFLSTRYGYRALPSIHIIVKNGDVRLEGVVANETDRNVAGIRANSVPGAFHVTNDLRVEGK